MGPQAWQSVRVRHDCLSGACGGAYEGSLAMAVPPERRPGLENQSFSVEF